MNDNGNLVPQSARTKDEQREIARKGGKASGKARRDKRMFREVFSMLLAMPDQAKDGAPLISPITGKPMSIRENIVVQALNKARRGDLKALSLILDTLGEKVLQTDVTIKSDRFDKMTDAELVKEAERLNDSINNL